MSKGGSKSSMTQAGGQSSFGGQMPMQQGYQSPFGNQSYRSQPSQPTFNNYSYQQPGQFGGQMMNQSMRSPGSKGGYRPPMRQQIPSPGGKGGNAGGNYGGQNPPMQQPMPSPGGKGRSYQSQQMPFGYGQTTFNPGQFGGYGQPSNIFSFNSPHYQPYVPPVYEPPPPPYRGNDPRDSGVTSSPPSTGSQGGTQRTMPDYSSSGVTGYQPSFGAKGGSQPSFGGKGGAGSVGGQPLSRYMPPEGYNTMPLPDYDPNPLRVFDPYGPGGPLEGQPRPTFPDPTQPQGPQGTIQGAPSMSGIILGSLGGGESQQPMGIAAPGGGPQFTPQRRINPPPPPDYGFTPPKAKPPSFSGINQDYINNNDMMRMRESFMPKTIHSAPVSFGSEYSKAPAQPAVEPPIQNETAAKNFWSEAQKAMDSGSLADADRFLKQYESITGTRNPMYGLSALDPSGYQSAKANR